MTQELFLTWIVCLSMCGETVKFIYDSSPKETCGQVTKSPLGFILSLNNKCRAVSRVAVLHVEIPQYLTMVSSRHFHLHNGNSASVRSRFLKSNVSIYQRLCFSHRFRAVSMRCLDSCNICYKISVVKYLILQRLGVQQSNNGDFLIASCPRKETAEEKVSVERRGLRRRLWLMGRKLPEMDKSIKW